VLTLAACLARSATVKPLYIIPMLFMAPIWLAMIPGIPFDAEAFARVRRGCAHYLILYLVAAPLIAGVGFAYAAAYAARPSREVARLVTKSWHEQYAAPLRFVGGDESYAIAFTFYSPDHPSYLLGFDRQPFVELGMISAAPDLTLSSWVTSPELAHHGMAIICSDEPRRYPGECNELVRSAGYEDANELKFTVATSLLGFRGPKYQFRVYFVPPALNERKN